MDCRAAQFFLRFRRPDGFAVSGGDLAPDDVAALDQHLASCPACAAESSYVSNFDRALGTAMRAVEAPVGLRTRLIASASAQRGNVLRRQAYRGVAVAASLFLAIAIGVGVFTAARPSPDTSELAMKGDDLARVMGLNAPVGLGGGHTDPQLAQANERAVRQWLKAAELPTDLPEPFDFGLLISYHWEEVQGRKVPVILFKGRDAGFAKVYVFRAAQFDLKGVQDAQASHCQAKAYPMDRAGVAFVIVFTGRDLAPFLKGHGGGGQVALAG